MSYICTAVFISINPHGPSVESSSVACSITDRASMSDRSRLYQSRRPRCGLMWCHSFCGVASGGRIAIFCVMSYRIYHSLTAITTANSHIAIILIKNNTMLCGTFRATFTTWNSQSLYCHLWIARHKMYTAIIISSQRQASRLCPDACMDAHIIHKWMDNPKT